MKISDVRGFSNEELVAKCADAREELFNLRLQKITGQLEKPSRVRELRRAIAKINTVIKQRELGIQPATDTVKADA